MSLAHGPVDHGNGGGPQVHRGSTAKTAACSLDSTHRVALLHENSPPYYAEDEEG
jgi:hypothetical protein